MAGFLSWTNLLLIMSGCAALVLYRLSLRAHTGPDVIWFLKIALIQSVLYVVAAWRLVKAKAARSTLLIVIAFAALFRLSLLFSPPYLSDDIYRYIWDGRVQAAGINPYRYTPRIPHWRNCGTIRFTHGSIAKTTPAPSILRRPKRSSF